MSALWSKIKVRRPASSGRNGGVSSIRQVHSGLLQVCLAKACEHIRTGRTAKLDLQQSRNDGKREMTFDQAFVDKEAPCCGNGVPTSSPEIVWIYSEKQNRLARLDSR